MKTPSTTSPLRLIQEELRSDPWKMLIACILLNRTKIRQVRPAFHDIIEKWPSPERLAAADHDEVRDVIRPLGFHNRRTQTLIEMSTQWASGERDPRALKGVGRYALDSWRIFVEGECDVEVTDKELAKYVVWAKETHFGSGR